MGNMKQILELPERSDNPFRLGRHYEWDARSLHWPTPHKTPAYNNTVWTDAGPLLNQGDVGSCTGDTVADLLNTDMFAPVRISKHKNCYFTQADAYNFYSKATTISGVGGGQFWPPNDVGSTGPAAAQAGVDFGYFDNYTHATTFDQFCASIEKQPVMLGVVWTNDMFSYDSAGVISVGSLNTSNQAGGHEFMGRAIFYDKNLVLCRNHWLGADGVTPWNPLNDGIKLPGEFYITIPDFKNLLLMQGDVTVPHGVGLPV